MENKELYPQEQAPAPAPIQETPKKQEEITAEAILNEVIGTDEQGYSPCIILAAIEMLHNVSENISSVIEIPEEDRETVEDMELQFCSVELFSLDNDLINVVLKFDTPKDSYKTDLLLLLDKYKEMFENTENIEGEPATIPMFSIAFAPSKFGGQAAAVMSFPVSYAKVLDENDEATCIQMMFHSENVDYQLLDVSEDEMTDLRAEVLREIEEENRQNNK